MPKLSGFKVCLKIPFVGDIEGTWVPDENEKHAAWEMYIELITRISVVELKSDEGLLREALSSLYALFDITRKILRQYGPKIAQPKGGGGLSFGYLAVNILNGAIRPVLAKWHPTLLAYEQNRPAQLAIPEYERQWQYNQELRQTLNGTRAILVEYANLLADVAGVPSLIAAPQQQ
jgi:hypothetical protein